MGVYRRKAAQTIQALQWTGDNPNEAFEFMLGKAERAVVERDHLRIVTDLGDMVLCPGDYILREFLGISCKKRDDFERVWEPMSGDDCAENP